MAFNSMLRRATKSFLPLATRAVGSPRTFHKTISSVLVGGEQILTHKLSFRNFVSTSQFSTEAAKIRSTDENLIRVIDTEIECADKPQEVDSIPNGFPFEIQDKDGERTITLTRKYNDEVINVEVDMLSPDVEVDAADDDDDNADNADKHNNTEVSGIPMVVKISKGNGCYLEFGITVFHNELSIDSLSFKNTEISDDQLAYDGPGFDELEGDLQDAFYKYLEVRGIKPSMTYFLFGYMTNKDCKEYLLWLTNLRKFVEK